MIEQGNQAIQPATSNDGGLNMHLALIRSVTEKISTATLVMVKKVDAATKTITVLPLVTQSDGYGKPIAQAVVYNVPYMPIQYGASAILMTPAAGDIGLCVFCHNDVSNVKATKKESLPGSYRKHSHSDAFYMGGVLNAAPTQYIEFTESQINIVTGQLNITGQVKANGKVIDDTHTHGGVQTGSGTTSPVS